MEEWPYPEEVVRKLLQARKVYESVLAYRAAEQMAFTQYRTLLNELRTEGVGMRTLARVMGVHASSIQRITGQEPQNGE